MTPCVELGAQDKSSGRQICLTSDGIRNDGVSVQVWGLMFLLGVFVSIGLNLRLWTIGGFDLRS